MVAPTPLRPQGNVEEPLESPEILVLNALVNSGIFNPEAFGLNVEMLVGYQTAWRWCQDYQDKVGTAPPAELFHRTFPQIESVANVDPRWAADQLHHAHYEREVRRKLQAASLAVREGDMEAAREAVRDLVQPSPVTKPKGLSATDIDSVIYDGLGIGFNVPWAPLNSATNGHGRGQFWLLAARLGQGKSWLAPGYMVAAAAQGARVAVASCEMPAKQYMKRVHAWQAHNNQKIITGLKSTVESERIKAVQSLPPLVGSIDVFDPSTMRMNIRAVEMLATEYDVIWVDHIGLLSDATGKRAIEDWRVMAVISNSMKEIALRYNVALAAAAQINREGENAGSSPPKVSQLSQSDALGQDADVVITLRKLGDRSMAHYLGKNRDGRNLRWHTKFEPTTADFREVTPDEAKNRMLADGDLNAND